LLFDTVDLHFLREERAAALAGHTSMAQRARHSRRSELALIEQADTSFVVSPYERELLAQLAPSAKVELLSNIHRAHDGRRGHTERRDLVFIGGAGHPPNVDALRWIATEILPRLRDVIPDLCVHALGDMPAALRRELAAPGLELHGRVPDLTPWLNRCLASIAPLRFGAGVKGKINMAMSHGVPVVATTVAVEGMQLRHGHDVLVADDGSAFADAVRRLRDDAALWDALSRHGMDNIRRNFSPGQAAEVLRHALN
jgi:glycosyltransferase involved in cell wall biosynthesis